MHIAFAGSRRDDKQNVNFTYFIKDKTKDGGAYIKTYGVVNKIDEDNRIIILDTKEEIPIEDILEINYS